jgi:hypothetical protein
MGLFSIFLVRAAAARRDGTGRMVSLTAYEAGGVAGASLAINPAIGEPANSTPSKGNRQRLARCLRHTGRRREHLNGRREHLSSQRRYARAAIGESRTLQSIPNA